MCTRASHLSVSLKSVRRCAPTYELVLIFLILTVNPSLLIAREWVDSTAVKVKVADHPKRIVTLAPSLGELVADLVGEEDFSRIVGVSEYTDFPASLARISSIGPYMKFNIEAVVALRPDLVIATTDGNPKDQVLHLRELGLPVFVIETAHLDQVAPSMRAVARAVDAEARGEKMASQFERGLSRIRERAKKRPKVSVLLQIGENPLMVAGKDTFLHGALEAVGASNVYGESGAHYPRPALEDVVKKNPDVILILALGKDLAPFHAMARTWERFPGLRATRGKKIQTLPGDAILRPTLRLLEGLSTLERAIYGSSK